MGWGCLYALKEKENSSHQHQLGKHTVHGTACIDQEVKRSKFKVAR